MLAGAVLVVDWAIVAKIAQGRDEHAKILAKVQKGWTWNVFECHHMLPLFMALSIHCFCNQSYPNLDFHANNLNPELVRRKRQLPLHKPDDHFTHDR